MIINPLPIKKASSDLAILGGTPLVTEKIHVGRPNIGDRQQLMSRIDEMLDRRWLTNNGVLVHEFENRIASFVQVKHCVAMCNATTALEIAIRALDIKGEVIMPSYTFVATANALQWQEITPVFADMDPLTHNINPRSIERLITPKTSAIVGVHVWGRPCCIEGIEDIGRKYRLKIIYDAAHAFGCSSQGKMIGGFGECEVFSFHATKFLNSFEGGAVVTNNDDLAEKLRLMRNFGFADYDRVIYLGINGKMTEVCAAMGLTSLEAMDELISINRRNWEGYQKGLRKIPGLSLIQYDPAERNNYQYIVIELDLDRASLNRDEIIRVLHTENILARKYFWPGCHRMEPYRSLQPNASTVLPETERIAARIFLLPTGQTVSLEMVANICEIIRVALANAPAVRSALGT